MQWPPEIGELLPHYDEPVEIERRLRTYSLDLDHEEGGPKAQGFLTVIGIGLESIDYLEGEIRVGIARTPISSGVDEGTRRRRLYGPIPNSGTRTLQSEDGLLADRLAGSRTRCEASDDDCLPARKGAEMTTTSVGISEIDVVALRNAAGGWPAGTEGTVVADLGGHMWVEISNERGEELDTISVPPSELRLVWKAPSRRLDADVD